MTAAADTKQRKATSPRKGAKRNGDAAAAGGANGNGVHVESVGAPPEEFVPTTAPAVTAPVGSVGGSPADEVPLEHPYGDRRVYVFEPADGSPPIVLPHISTAPPTALFLYDNRHKDELRQCFAWMDHAGVPDFIGRRVWQLPEVEQGLIMQGWFGGLQLRQPQGVTPPGES